MAKQRAVVVFSGGQDSTTALFWALAQGLEVRALSFNYGQRHGVELESARRIAKEAGVLHQVVEVPKILVSRSPLVSPLVELETYSDYQEMDEIIGDRVEKTFVPMRNALFLTLAANRAVAWDAFTLVTGVCESDNANYPDCRQAFIHSQEETISQALGVVFTILAPLICMDKEQIVKLAHSMPDCWAAMRHTHTCYAGEHPGCGKCHSCVLRAEGFRRAGLADPLFEAVA